MCYLCTCLWESAKMREFLIFFFTFDILTLWFRVYDTPLKWCQRRGAPFRFRFFWNYSSDCVIIKHKRTRRSENYRKTNCSKAKARKCSYSDQFFMLDLFYCVCVVNWIYSSRFVNYDPSSWFASLVRPIGFLFRFQKHVLRNIFYSSRSKLGRYWPN